jgi:hypothetical protein
MAMDSSGFGRSHWLSTVTSFASTTVPNSRTWNRNTKRLGHDIGFLGIKTAMGRASEPIMQASGLVRIHLPIPTTATSR